jgi:hypothetical protein
MFACMEKGAAGFVAVENMKAKTFAASAKFILKYDDKTPKLISGDKFLSKHEPQICSTDRSSGITCMTQDGEVLMHFIESSMTYRWVLLGKNDDDTVITHGACEKF